MKTVEEKAKAYDEALERAKKLQETCDSTTVVGWCEYIFQELRESEDEKIRKEIISFIQDDIDEINLKVSGDYDDRDEDDIAHQIWCKKAIAWIEKQSEQKPTLPKWKYKKDNTTLLKDSLVLNKCGHMAKLSSGAIVSDVWVVDYDELAKLPKEELEEQGAITAVKKLYKQKLSEWSEEDETNSYHLETLLENLAKDIKHEFRVISDNDRDKYTAWLKSLKDRVQPKQEWSEEDELMFISTIQGIEMTNGAAQLKIDWLKSLKQRIGG